MTDWRTIATILRATDKERDKMERRERADCYRRGYRDGYAAAKRDVTELLLRRESGRAGPSD